VEKIQPIQDALESTSQRLDSRWDSLYENRLSVDEFKRLSADTRDFMEEFSARTRKTNALLLEIMLAQGFQDLTGQVIKKIFELARMMEQELLQLLVDAIPPEKRAALGADFLNGPVINPAGRDDVAANQAQVDELLESLGF
jgi:chemotaxis protein CheZ